MQQWEHLLGEQKQQPHFQKAHEYVAQRRFEGVVVYPPDTDVFNAFALCSPKQLKVVILGQDPYHGANQAHGLCFSVLEGNKVPPSLRNIYKELVSDIPTFSLPAHGNLSAWAKQGVLLLNTVLTVEDGQANSHKGIGWEQFTDAVITNINAQLNGIIFVLWGGPAQKKTRLIDSDKHYVLTAPHPSPLSAHRGFLGCGHFSEINRILTNSKRTQIDWSIE